MKSSIIDPIRYSNRFMIVVLLSVVLVADRCSFVYAQRNCSEFSSSGVSAYVFLLYLHTLMLQYTYFLPTDNDNYWDAISKCPLCNADNGCGYCLSTLTCMEGTAEVYTFPACVQAYIHNNLYTLSQNTIHYLQFFICMVNTFSGPCEWITMPLMDF